MTAVTVDTSPILNHGYWRLAPYGRRAIAWCIDFAIAAAICAVAFFTVALVGVETVGGALAASAALVIAFFTWRESGGRRSPGKVATGLRLVGDEDEVPSIGMALGRTICRFIVVPMVAVLIIVPAALLVQVIAIEFVLCVLTFTAPFWISDRQSLGDCTAATVVVVNDKSKALVF